MKNKRIGDVFWGFLLAAALSFAGVGCVTSGFALRDIDLSVLLLVSLGGGLVWAIASRFRYGILITAAAMEVIWLLPNAREIIDSEAVLLYQISKALNSGYGWPVLYWDSITPGATAQSALVLIILLVSLAVAWTVVRQKKATLAAIAAFLPMMVCLILTDTVPDNDYLMLMLGGLVLLALTNPLRCMNAKQANRATAVLLIPVMLATMGLFTAVPRENYKPNQSAFEELEQWLRENPLWQWFTGEGPSWSMGDTGAEQVSLDALGGKSDSGEIALYITSEKDGYLYLRGRGYDTYDGRHWTASEQSSGKDGGWSPAHSGSPSVTVRMDYARDFYYFSSDTGPTDTVRDFEYGMLPNPERETTYTFLWATPISKGSYPRAILDKCKELPEQTRQWALDTLVKSKYFGSVAYYNDSARAMWAADLVRRSAEYSLTPDPMPQDQDDFAAWFFDEAESGYCVHFATVATILLRAMDIPARYVTGYAVDVLKNEEIAVTQSKAHAWVEYYAYEDHCWKVLDPTPGYNDQPSTEPTVPTAPTTEPTETTGPTETTAPVDETTEPTSTQDTTAPVTQPTLPSETQAVLPGSPAPGGREDNGFAKKVMAVLLWVAGICAAVWGQYRLRIRIRNWYLRRGDANRQALTRWRAVCIRSRIFRQKVPNKLRALAEKAKFSQHTLTEAELSEFDSHMRRLAMKLYEKPWLLRWLLRFILAIE